VDCHGPEGVPPSNDPEYNNYDYTPKPPDDSSHFPMRELLHYFENPECAGTSENCLKIIPKRIVGKLGQERIAWGLELRQNLCPVRVTLLFMIVWSSSMGFAGWWLSENPGDLQNATVPASMIATIVTVAAILPDVFGHYQNNRNIRHP